MSLILEVNEKLLLWINSGVGKLTPLDSLMRFLVNDYFVPVSLSLVLLWLWFTGQDRAQRERHQKAVFCGAISVGITSAAVKILNLFYSAPRPFQEIPSLLSTVNKIFYPPHDPSFPSNAAAISFAIATAVWLGDRKTGTWLLFLAFLYSFSRVYAAVHYPLDIAGGALLGIVISYLISRLLLLAEPLPTLVLKLLRKLCLA
jgi:undecaprenyl-diphosphatase